MNLKHDHCSLCGQVTNAICIRKRDAKTQAIVETTTYQVCSTCDAPHTRTTPTWALNP